MTAYGIIRNAILNKQQVTATYRGHNRELCPHILGYKNGRRNLFSYQFAGSSRRGLEYLPGSLKNWRCMSVDALENVKVRDGDWHTASNYSSSTQRCVDEIDVEI